MGSSVDTQKEKDKVEKLLGDAENGECSKVIQANMQESALYLVDITEIGDTVSSLEKLRSDAMRGKWSDVFETYKQERALRMASITPTGDTVLHMAVSDGEAKVVADMVDFLVKEEKSPTQDNVVGAVDGDGGNESSWNKNSFLGVENDRKDTPLHLAGRKGRYRICEKIGSTDPSLIARRNIDGETPLFLAALYGQRDTFLWLHYLYVGDHEVSSTNFAHYCIRNNHDTILHCAIAEGHFGVAIEIVYLYKDHLKEMMKRNKEGLTPLHLLAAKRSAFKTTALLEVTLLLHPIYWYWKVEEKKQATTFDELKSFRKSMQNFRKIAEDDTPGEESFLSESTKFTILIIGLSFCVLFCLQLVLFALVGPVLMVNVTVPLIAFPVILPIGFFIFLRLLTISEEAIERWFRNMPRMKKKHTRCYQIMTKLLKHASAEDMSQVISRNASKQFSDSLQSEELNEREAMAKPPSGTVTIETPLMIAVKNGVVEMVEKILELFPSTIKDVNDEGKNILLLAVEYRQTNVYGFLCNQKWINESVFSKVDKEGNNALHLAARLGLNPEGNLSMEEEINWYKFVKDTMPVAGLLGRYNRNMETPGETFRESHKEYKKSEAEWVVKTSEACSVVSTLVVSVAFSTRTGVPGGYDSGNGYALLRNNPLEFKTFRDSSFMALFCSLTSTICFLSIVADSRSPSAHSHSRRYVPSKFHLGIYFMFASIVCLWISFCAADFFMLHDQTHKLKKALPTYILLSVGIILSVVLQLLTFLRPILSNLLGIISSRRKTTGPIEYRRTNNKDKDSNNQN